jgi:hypothetical protein
LLVLWRRTPKPLKQTLDAFVKGDVVKEFSTCAECGMTVIMSEYHPYAACVLYRQTHQSEKVADLLRDVALYGYQAAKNGLELDDALRNIAASNTASTRRGGTVAKKDKVAKPPRG